MTQFKSFMLFITLAGFVSIFTACENAEEIIEAISESDAVEIIEANLQNNAGGVVTNLEDVAEQLVTAVASGALCDTLYTDTVEEDFQGVRFQAIYTSELSYEMSCNQFNIPQTATLTILTSTMYNSTRIVSDDNADFSGGVTGLQPSALTINVDGEYVRTGTQELNFMTQKNITSTLAITLADVEMNKQSLEIESGMGIVLFTGSTADESFSFDGDIVFNGDNTATLTINGNTYEIDWD